MIRAALAVVALGFAGGLAAAGCGTASPSISRLRREATQVCERALARSDAIKAPALPAGTAAFVRRGAAALRAELAELRALKAPVDQAATYSTAVGAMSEQLALLDETIRGLDGGADPLSAINMLQRRLSPTESAENTAWRALDIPGCVSR